MTIPAGRKTSNIRRSIQVRIGDEVSTDTTGARGQTTSVTAQIHHGDPWADPEAVGDPSQVPADQWLTTTWVEDGAGRRGSSLLQIDVYSLIKGRGDLDGDPHGMIADDLADAVEALFVGREDDGLGAERALIPVSDYIVPTSPVATTETALCITSSGSRGTPQDRRRVRAGAHWRITLRFRFRLIRDLYDNDAALT
ncbi:MAG: hypothetical protein ACE366_16460 [Bradymonadia bacterium]